MKLDEIRKMSDAKLDAAITDWLQRDGDSGRCPVCGWPYAKDAARGCVPANCSMRPVPKHGRWQFCASLDACHAAEERLIADGVERVWVFELLRVLMPDARNTIMCGMAHLPQEVLVHVAHATARQRAEAILLAVQEGETP